MHHSFIKKFGTACLQLALSASSISAIGAANSYYRNRRSSYASNKQYIADIASNPLMSSHVRHTNVSNVKNFPQIPEEVNFTKGRKVRELVIVDGDVQNKSVFYKQLKPGLEVVEIKRNSGLVGLMTILSAYQDLDAIHLVSHASPGQLQLGGQVVDANTLHTNVNTFATLNGAIKEGGDLLIYGCEFGQGKEGDDFLQIVKGNTHADVAASSNKTGNSAFGGDWNLEIQKGDIEATPLPGSIALNDFTGVLQVDFTPLNSKVVDDGGYASGDNISFYEDLGTSYTVIFDGNQHGTHNYYGAGDYALTYSNGSTPAGLENSVDIYLSGNLQFQPTSIYIYRNESLAGTQTFTVTSNISGSATTTALNNQAGETLDLSGLSPNTSVLTITGSTLGVVGGPGFQIRMNNLSLIVTPPNTAPTIAGAATLSAISEDAGDDDGSGADGDDDAANNANNSGYTIASIIADGGITYSESNGGDDQGLAITGRDNTNGEWQYSTNTGSTWTAVPVVSNSSALLLNDDAANLVRFVPNADYNGSSGNLTFQAWDVTDANSSGATGIDVSGGGGTSAYSSGSATASLTVNSVNDAPSTDLNGVAGGDDASVSFTEEGSALDLMSSPTITDVDDTTFPTLTITVSGVLDGDEEELVIDGSTLVLGSDNTISPTSGGSFDIGYVSGTGVITITLNGGGEMAEAALETLLDGITYDHTNDDDPQDGDRVLTISVSDGDDPSADNTVTINVDPVNDEPTASYTTSTPTFTQGTSPVSLFSDTDINTIETPQDLTGFVIQVVNVSDGGSVGQDEVINIDGIDITLNNGNSASGVTTGSTFTTFDYAVVEGGGTSTITISNFSESEAIVESVINSLTYENVNATPSTGSTRDVTLTSLTDTDGSTPVTNASLGLGTTSVTVAADAVAPTFENSTPSASSIGGTGFTLDTDIDEPGTIYYVVLADGTTAPSASDVINLTGTAASPEASGNSATGAGPNYVNALSVTGLTSETTYDVYVVAEDGASNTTLEPLADVTTADITAPTLINAALTQTAPDALEITYQSNEVGTIYYIVTTDNSLAPTTAQIFNGNDGSGDADDVLTSDDIAVTITGSDQTIGLSSLTLSSTTYYVYFYESDAAGNESGVSNANVTTDITAPSIINEALTQTDADELEITYQSNEVGTIYYVVTTDNALAPTTTQIFNGNDGSNDADDVLLNGNTTVTITGSDQTIILSGLTMISTDYYVYFYESDDIGNESGVVVASETVDATPPAVTNLEIFDTDEDGFIDQVIISFSEDVAPVDGTESFNELGTLTLPDGLTVTDNGLTITHPYSADASKVLVSGISDQETFNTASGSMDIDDLENLWRDLIGNQITAGGDESETVTDSAEPVLTSSSPSAGALSFPTDGTIVLNFSENVSVESGNIYLVDENTGNNDFSETFGTGDISGNGTSAISINPSNDLDDGDTYHLLIDAGFFEDAVNIDYDGIASTTELAFTIGDLSPDVCSSDTYPTGPGDNDIHINNSKCNIENATFSSLWDTEGEMQPVFYFNLMNGSNTAETFTSITIDNGNTDVDWGDIIQGAVLVNEDGASETVNIIDDDFLTFSGISPSGFGFVPGANSKTRGVEHVLYVYLKTSTNLDDIDNEALVFTLDQNGFAGGDTPIATNASSGTSNNLVKVIADRLVLVNDPSVGTPHERASTSLTVSVRAQDENGNLDLDETSEVSLTGPTDFDGAGTTSLTFDLVAGLATSSSFTIYSEEEDVELAIADNDGNTGSEGSATTIANDANSTAFDVYDTTPATVNAPTGADLTPFHTDTEAEITNELEIVFSEDVAKGSGSISVVWNKTPPVVETINVNGAKVSITDNIATISLSENLETGADYYVLVPNGVFLDANDNASINGSNGGFAGYSSSSNWTFTTESVSLVSIDDVTVDEDAGIASFTVSIDIADPTNDIVIDYTTTNGTAEDEGTDNDFTSASGTLTFLAGTATLTQTVDITINDDDLIEGSETFTVDLTFNGSNTSDAVLDDDSGLGTINIDDVAGFTLSKTTATVSEDGVTTTDAFTVVLDAEPTSNVEISVVSGDTGEGT
ncbi:MAG: DUF4347 domain-containing protein, partial [Marinoscillum sp.]